MLFFISLISISSHFASADTMYVGSYGKLKLIFANSYLQCVVNAKRTEQPDRDTRFSIWRRFLIQIVLIRNY